MRRSASLMTSLEGTSLAAFRVAQELAGNSRSGLTVRFLSKKLEMTEEEVEYIIDVNPRLMFLDLTKVKIVAEGQTAVKRIQDGLENHGDVPSLMRRVKGLSSHDFRNLEELIGSEQPCTKKQAAEELLDKYYRHPDSVQHYVGSRDFSETAREVFDIVWQSKDGVLPVSQIRVAHGGRDSRVEQGLSELFHGFALFEMFRFDSEDRLVRVAGILKETRQWNEANRAGGSGGTTLKAVKVKPDRPIAYHLDLSDTLCKLVAAIAARPARLRGDGELFREDRRRLGEIRTEDDEPSLSFCLWAAEGLNWITRVDNELRAADIEDLIELDRVSRHKRVCDWLCGQGDVAGARHQMSGLLDDLKANAWYRCTDFVSYASHVASQEEQPILKQKGAHWAYTSPAASGNAESRMARALEESFFWLGLAERASDDGESLFRLTGIGESYFLDIDMAPLQERFPPRPGEFVVQPNFDVVVPTQDMDPLLTVPLDQFARRSSSGQATVYHVSKESFTQALQEGHDAVAFVDFLIRHNREEALPKNVMMTLEDWMGAIKRVHVRTLHVVESDDPLVMADLQHRRKFKKYFSMVDPKSVVRYEGITKAELGKLLEKEGFVVE